MSHPFLGPRFKEGVDQLEQLEQRVIKLVAAGSILRYEKGLRELGLFSLKKDHCSGPSRSSPVPIRGLLRR